MKKLKAFAALLLSTVTVFTTSAPVLASDDASDATSAVVAQETTEVEAENTCINTVEELYAVVEKAKTGHNANEVNVSRNIKLSPTVVTESKVYDAKTPVMATLKAALAANANLAVFGVLFPAMPVTDDGLLYMYALNPYEYSIPMGAMPVTSAPADTAVIFQFPLNFGRADSRLFQKFVAAVKINGQMVQVSQPQYITNPEILATHTKPYNPIVKGFQISSMWNVHTEGNGGPYTTYGMPVIKLIASLNPASVTVNPYAQIPDSHPIPHNEFALNCFNQAGVNALVADATSLALGSGQAFIIGNEVNERQRYYMSYVGDDTFVREYYQAFRVAYNAIKSQNANARVFISVTQDWNRNRPGDAIMYTDGKDFCDIFNSYINMEGNIDYGISLHPYTVPLTYAKFWDMSGCANGGYMANQIKSNAMFSFQNMSIVTNYLTQPAFLNQYGQPRYFMIDEIGVSALQGADVQAAALATLWVSYVTNPYIHELIYCNGADMSTNPTLSGISLDMWNSFGTPSEATYLQWAMNFMHISNWTQVIR